MNRNSSMAGLASLVQSRGRNGDSMLVHMTPGEVRGLQSLALAHGGQLTINPDTGLYEANFLKKLLPTVLGFGLNFLFPGLGALGSAALVGAGETIRTGGDLGKGLMAGLGAYGGAGLGAGLAGAAKAGGEAALTEVTTTAAAKKAAEEAARAGAGEVAKTAATETAKKGLFSLNPDMSGTLQSYGQGVKALGNKFGREGFMSAIPGGQMGAAAGLMGVSSALSPDMEVPGGGYQIDDSYYESMGYSPEQGRFLGGQWRKGYPGFPPPGMAEGGVIPAPNGNYPLARPSEALGGYEASIDPYTGEERFADGGNVGGSPDLASYYQSLLSPPAQQAAPNQAFSNYLQGLNQFVTSPVAPPPPPPKQQPPAAGIVPPGAGGRPIAGGGRPPVSQPPNARFPYRGRYGGDEGDIFLNTGDMYGGGDGGGAMRWDANQGRFVSDAPRTPFSAGNMPSGSPFSGFGGIDFSALQRMSSGGAGPSGGMPGGQNQYGGDVSNMPLVNEYDQFIGDMGQGVAGTPPQDQGQQPSPDFSGMDFSGLQNMNLNMSGIGGSGSYMPDTSQQYQPYTGQQYAPETPETYDNPFANQQYQQYQPDMSQQYQPEYAGGTPNYDMGNQPIQEFLGTPYMPEMAYGPLTDVTNQYPGVYGPTTTFSDLTAAETYDPTAGRQPVERPVFPSGDQMQYAPPPPDFSGVDSGLIPQAPPESMQPGLSGYVPPPDMGGLSFAAFKPPQPEVPPPSMSQMLGGFDGTGGGYGGSMGGLGSLGGMPQMQQAAPQPMPQPMPQQAPPPDMSGFGGFGGGFSGGFDMSGGEFAAGGPIQYAAGGKFLRGPGDGMSDDIKANINGEQEARLADGEFVIPADVVSHIGNGSSEAGADRLYKMMADIRKARTGKTRQAPQINPKKYLPS